MAHSGRSEAWAGRSASLPKPEATGGSRTSWDRLTVDALVEAVERSGEGDDQARVLVGGIAYAGARGISRVEVRVDGGPWQGPAARTWASAGAASGPR